MRSGNSMMSGIKPCAWLPTDRRRWLPAPRPDARSARGRASTTRNPCRSGSRSRTGTRLTAVFAAEPAFEVMTSPAARFHGQFDELAPAFLIEHREGIGLEDLLLLVVFLEFRVVVARETHRGLRQVIGTEREELSRGSDAICCERGARDFDHRADRCTRLHSPAFSNTSSADAA